MGISLLSYKKTASSNYISIIVVNILSAYLPITPSPLRATDRHINYISKFPEAAHKMAEPYAFVYFLVSFGY